jgi:hypothetical protein
MWEEVETFSSLLPNGVCSFFPEANLSEATQSSPSNLKLSGAFHSHLFILGTCTILYLYRGKCFIDKLTPVFQRNNEYCLFRDQSSLAFNIQELCILLAECSCGFVMILTVDSDYSSEGHNRLGLVAKT